MFSCCSWAVARQILESVPQKSCTVTKNWLFSQLSDKSVHRKTLVVMAMIDSCVVRRWLSAAHEGARHTIGLTTHDARGECSAVGAVMCYVRSRSNEIAGTATQSTASIRTDYGWFGKLQENSASVSESNCHSQQLSRFMDSGMWCGSWRACGIIILCCVFEAMLLTFKMQGLLSKVSELWRTSKPREVCLHRYGNCPLEAVCCRWFVIGRSVLFSHVLSTWPTSCHRLTVIVLVVSCHRIATAWSTSKIGWSRKRWHNLDDNIASKAMTDIANEDVYL